MWCPCCIMSFVLESSTKFSQVSWLVLWLMWPRDQSTLTRAVLKIEKERKEKKNKIRWKKKNKIKSTVNNLDTYGTCIDNGDEE